AVQRCRGRDAKASPRRPPRPETPRRPPRPCLSGPSDEAEHDGSVDLERDMGAPGQVAGQEEGGAVDGIEEPATRPVAIDPASLFAQYRVVGPFGGKDI